MSSKTGYIKLYRSLTDNEIYMLPPLYLRVFERLVMEANHQDNEIPYRKNGEVKTKLIKRGERLTSIRQISEWVEWYERGILKKPNPKLIKEILDYLVNNEMIIIYNDKGNRTETHYKVVNYEVYQDKEDAKVTEQKQNRNDIETEKKQLVPQNNNDKNDNNEKNEEEIINNSAETKPKKPKKTKPVINKISYAEFVSMTEDEYSKLVEEHGEANTKRMIMILDNYKGSSGKTYKDDYRAILNWVVDRVKNDKGYINKGRDDNGKTRGHDDFEPNPADTLYSRKKF